MAQNKMKYSNHIYYLLFFFLLASCKKSNTFPEGSTSLVIVNAIPGSKPLKADFTDGKNPLFIYSRSISYGDVSTNSNFYLGYKGEQHLKLYQYPDTTVKDQPLFDMRFEIPPGSMQTLFLTGTTAAPESVRLNESFPEIPWKDSAMAVRFIHLSPGSEAVTVNLQGSSEKIVSGLAYRQVTDFRKYVVLATTADYVFEIRDALSGNLITSYTFTKTAGNLRYRRNFYTVVFGGLPGESGQLAHRTFRLSHLTGF
ncbi:hypothetical protein EV199_5767 [Pseudobacter ginsenosidimutans]|uniref:DUF4397 domain-containing protein n=2 Tax=Pseudobacter ginsenosidimutans TaxID=661488 RepID=A0A4Q7MFS7_9BACT|nr:hypothetical protein EV199_5767 [Pseudobacter ginsenosidimutans]